MINHRAVRCIWVAAALLFAPAQAAEESHVSEMMLVSGMAEQFADLGEGFRAGILQSAEAQPELPPHVAEDLAEIGARAMEGEGFLADLEIALAETLAAEEVEAVTAFYGSELGGRIKAVEVAASTPSAQLEIEARSAELIADLREDPERLALARRIDDMLHASELSATMAIAVGMSMALGMLRSQPQGQTADALAAMDQYFSSMQASLVEQMREFVLASFAYTYREVSSDDLEAYVRFLETNEARATYAAVSAAVYEIMSQRGEEIGKAFGALIRQKRT